jgi:hypothetical protein
LYATIFVGGRFGPKILAIIRNRHNTIQISPFDDLPVHKAIFEKLPAEEVTCLITTYKDTLCRKDGDGNMAFQLAMKYNVKHEVLVELLRYLLPVNYDEDGNKIVVDPSGHGFAWADLVQSLEHVDVVEEMLFEYADLAIELASCLDFKGRVVEHIACPASQLLLKRQRYFLKRSQLYTILIL